MQFLGLRRRRCPLKFSGLKIRGQAPCSPATLNFKIPRRPEIWQVASEISADLRL
ncbi:hypothetical protein [uncultured Campylobacter sp.]|uniref:hypothetical protein n=1 Tax=uncultured Campylobacter sp. TaxID=218934 RepID=UPI002603F624|nr:hypothetical protein [uncultured Campylobacter sp.]